MLSTVRKGKRISANKDNRQITSVKVSKLTVSSRIVRGISPSTNSMPLSRRTRQRKRPTKQRTLLELT